MRPNKPTIFVRREYAPLWLVRKGKMDDRRMKGEGTETESEGTEDREINE